MKKIFQIIVVSLLILSPWFLFSKFQDYQKQQYFEKSQQQQLEGDKIYGQKVLEERRKDPLFDLLPVETSQFQIVPTMDVRYEYTIVAKIEDKEKVKQAFFDWVKDKNIDISNLTILYE